MWLKNFYNELKAWHIIRKVYKENKSEFEKIGLKKDWFGRLWLVINRDPKIPLGSAEDEELLGNELHIISDFLIKMNIMDILAYELIPLEKHDEETYENAYLIKLTPAWNLTKQYVNKWSISFIVLFNLLNRLLYFFNIILLLLSLILL